jgi:hypothetical protein
MTENVRKAVFWVTCLAVNDGCLFRWPSYHSF